MQGKSLTDDEFIQLVKEDTDHIHLNNVLVEQLAPNPNFWDIQQAGKWKRNLFELASRLEKDVPYSWLGGKKMPSPHAQHLGKRYARDIYGFSIREAKRERAKPLLEELLSHAQTKRVQNTLKRIQMNVDIALAHPPGISQDAGDGWGTIIDTDHNEAISAPAIILAGDQWYAIIDELESHGLGGIQKLRNIEKRLRENLLTAEPQKIHPIAAAYSAIATQEALPLLPLIIPYHKQAKIHQRKVLSSKRILNQTPDQPEMLREVAKEVLSGQAYSLKKLMHHQTELHELYSEHAQQPDTKWFGVAGMLLLSKKTNGYNQLPAEDIKNALALAGEQDAIRGIKKEVYRAHIARIISEQDEVALGSKDPFQLQGLRTFRKHWRRALNKWSYLFSENTLTTIDEVIGVNLNRNIQVVEEFSTQFTKRKVPDYYDDPIFREIGKYTQARLKGTLLDFDTMYALTDELHQLKGEVSQQTVMQLAQAAGEVSNCTKESAVSWIQLLAHPRVAQKYLGTNQAAKKRRQALWTLRESFPNLEKHAAHKEKDTETLKRLNGYLAKEILKDQLPYAQIFRLGWNHQPNKTYSFFRKIATNTSHAHIVAKYLNTVQKRRAPASRSFSSPQITFTQAYTEYTVIAQRIGMLDTKTGERIKRQRAKLRKLEKQLGDLHHTYNAESEKRTTMDAQLIKARVTKATRITLDWMHAVIDEVWDNAYQLSLENILSDAPKGAGDDVLVRQALGVHDSISSEYSKEQLSKLIDSYLTYRPFVTELQKNTAFLNRCKNSGIDTLPWMSRYSIQSTAVRGGSTRHAYNHYLSEIKRIAQKAGVTYQSIEQVRRKLDEKADDDLLMDFYVQYEAISHLEQESEITGEEAVEVSLASPMEALLMGDAVDGSCVAIGKTNTHNAVAAAIDANKAVAYVRKDGEIIGRKAYAITKDHMLVQYPTYTRGNWNLENTFEEFSRRLSARMNIQRSNSGFAEGLEVAYWEPDPTTAFIPSERERVA